MKNFLSFLVCVFLMSQTPVLAEQQACASWLDHSMQKLHSSETVDLCETTAAKPVLIVNTASYCGYTYQFSALESLYQAYKERGLVVIGFPSDSFNQEDEDAAKTAEVCYINHGVSFPMTEVVKVKGQDAHPLFQHLAREQGAPSWNFNKYLISRNGDVIKHFSSKVEPDSVALRQAIEELL